MVSMKVVQVVGVAGVASLSWAGGILYQKNKENATPIDVQSASKPRPHLPGLPLGGQVSASVAVVPHTETGVTIPPRDTGVPPEPLNGSPRVAEIMRFGFPGLDNIRSHKDYIMSYDRRNRIPHWVFEHLTKDSCQKTEGVDRAHSDFSVDKSLHPFFQSANTDYKYSGFDRGHMAPAGNHRRDQQMCNETFLLSNMAPQVGRGFNRDKWEHLERYVRKMTKLYRNVYVCTGPLYLPHMEQDGKMYVKYQVIGQNNVSVPTHFFKVIVGETDNKDLELEAFVMPNEQIPDNTPLDNFRVPPDSVERAAGLLFFDRLSKERLSRINGQKTGNGWF